MGESFVVLVAPYEPGLQVLGVLRDWSAVGLLQEFYWVHADEVPEGLAPIPAVRISGGRAEPVELQRRLAVIARPDVVRVCVLDDLRGSLVAPAGRRVASVLNAASPATRQTLVHCLGATLGGSVDRAPDVPRGWHGVLIAPEDALGPLEARRQVLSSEDDLAVAMHYASGVSGVLGLWTGVPGLPCRLDGAMPPPGSQVRLSRGFFRRLDAEQVEADLRNALTQVQDGLPQPSKDGRPLPYVTDETAAVETAADNLLARHSWLLSAEREQVAPPIATRVGPLQALQMLLSFLWAALTRAPALWVKSVLDRGATRIAGMAQGSVFGKESAYEVVVAGRLPDGRLASMEDVEAAFEDVLEAWPQAQRHEELGHDQKVLWRDYVNAGLSLVDGQERVPDVPQPRVGASPAVVRTTGRVSPAPTAEYRDLPPYLTVALGVEAIAPWDSLRTESVLQHLDELSTDRQLARDAQATRPQILSWRAATQEGTFVGRVGSRLSRRMQELRLEIANLKRSIADAAREIDVDSSFVEQQERLARRMRWTFWIGLVAILAFVGAGWAGWLGWSTAAWWIFGLVIAWFITLTVQFLLGQREVFRLLNRQQQLNESMGAHKRNLGASMADLQRVSAAYAQFLDRSRGLGAFLAQPLGPPVQAVADHVDLADDLPLAVQLGEVPAVPASVGAAAAIMRPKLFPVGWLQEPAEHALGPERILGPVPHLPGVEVGDALWVNAMSELAGLGSSPAGRALVERARWVGDHGPSRPGDAPLALDQGESTQFDPEILTPRARSGPARSIDSDLTVARKGHGLGGSVVLLQFSPAFLAEDLAVQVAPRHVETTSGVPHRGDLSEAAPDLGF